MDVSLSELRELVMDREAWRAAIHGITSSRTWLSNWTELKVNVYFNFCFLFKKENEDTIIGCLVTLLFFWVFLKIPQKYV